MFIHNWVEAIPLFRYSSLAIDHSQIAYIPCFLLSLRVGLLLLRGMLCQLLSIYITQMYFIHIYLFAWLTYHGAPY